MALVQLARWLAHDAVDHATTPHGRALGDVVRPAQDVGLGLNLQKLARFVELSLCEGAVPGSEAVSFSVVDIGATAADA